MEEWGSAAADSAGYLREAVALSKGQGFSYDGLSGYESWFANWPIVYPALIAGMMLLTGANAYLASKLLTMALVGLLLLVQEAHQISRDRRSAVWGTGGDLTGPRTI